MRFLGFGLIFTLAIFAVSCHQTGFPHGGREYADRGSTSGGGGGDGTGNDGFRPPFPPTGEGGIPGGNIPGWDTGSPSNPGGRMTVAEQLDWLRNNAPAGSGFNVWAWQNVPERFYNQAIEGVDGAAITVLMQSYYAQSRSLQLGMGGNTMFTVQGATLILQNIELLGRPGNSAALVSTAAGGTVTMGRYSVIRSSHYGVVVGNGGILNMDRNSAVRNNNVDGVRVMNGGVMNMIENASVSGSQARDGVSLIGGRLEMREQSVIYNNAVRGVRIGSNGSLFMTGEALITANNGGVHSNTGTIEMSENALIFSNAIFYASGGGVNANNTTLTMRGNAGIRNNFVVSQSPAQAGGVVLMNSTLNMLDDAEISGNVCHQSGNIGHPGGGVTASNSTIRMRNRASIHSNTNFNATNGSGGVWLHNSSLYMHDNDVRIKGNATHRSEGGGVRLQFNSTLTIHGGLIYGINHTDSPNRNVRAAGTPPAGHALYINGTGSTVTGVGLGGITTRNNTFGVQNGSPVL